jgi:hypothetical protein
VEEPEPGYPVEDPEPGYPDEEPGLENGDEEPGLENADGAPEPGYPDDEPEPGYPGEAAGPRPEYPDGAGVLDGGVLEDWVLGWVLGDWVLDDGAPGDPKIAEGRGWVLRSRSASDSTTAAGAPVEGASPDGRSDAGVAQGACHMSG